LAPPNVEFGELVKDLELMKFIHISDTHFVPPGQTLHGLDPRERFDACVADINLHHQDAELCVITGDLAQSGRPEAYGALSQSLAALRIPVHLMRGNHDGRGPLLAAFPNLPTDPDGYVQSGFETIAGRFLLLDTVEEGRGWGSYCKKRLGWLKNQLDLAAGRPIYLFTHHPPFPVGLPSVDRLGLGADGARIGEVLAPYDNIRHLFIGHVHRPIAGSWQGIPYSIIRGTNHQVPLDFDAVEVVPKSHEPPAYAVVFLDAHQTTVHFHDYLDTHRVAYDKKSEGRPDWK
jgi:3',5'-cyclic AMP phosphodiesterase CpdA